ncbi:hypothetical protein [Vibrio metschnikovii]|uniref:hypothetical protein n=1 Tax=Vibrio metschnikovii TaxID=28172 RepID=UPI0005F24506|nr:hypothetical protein [Vibrio metschnikovii]EKO3604758.1 hypothetical protein [Vibrio metschnikovii]EKO3678202.1 hypothetical protein [Vibrio metschnikovii]EKQ5812125.1 hypothetical protein [Vibrio metschnikovii]KJS07216.1 MAG: hypothetical protein VR73_09225 [Gammaproteobacteria bacterium BRH_c0]
MTFSDRIWSAAVKSWGALFTIIGLAVSVIGFFIVPSSQAVPLNIVVVLGLLIFVVLGIFIRAAYDANVDSTVSLPRVRTVIEPPATYRDASALLLLDPTELLSHDSIVSVYYLDGGIERLSGIGKVINIQNDKKIQVILIKEAEFSEKVEALKANKPEDLAKLIVKPSVPSFYLGGE